jgi:hypothetical protein
MSDVLVFERTSTSFAAGLTKRGHHIVYRANSANHCPGCGRSQWYIGRVSAECGFCGTAVPLAETGRQEATAAPAPRPRNVSPTADQRRFPRMADKGRKLKLLIDGSPRSFALHNISEGGVMGAAPDLTPGAKVHVRFEGGILVPAVVRWAEDGLVGLAFVDPVVLDRSDPPRN